MEENNVHGVLGYCMAVFLLWVKASILLASGIKAVIIIYRNFSFIASSSNHPSVYIHSKPLFLHFSSIIYYPKSIAMSENPGGDPLLSELCTIW